MSKLLQESGELCCLFSRNPAKLADVWCLELCVGTLFVLLLKFGAVLTIICGYEWLLKTVSWLEAQTAVYCYRAVFSEVAKLHKLAVGKLDLLGGWSLTQCYGVLHQGLNLHRNIPLITCLKGVTLRNLLCHRHILLTEPRRIFFLALSCLYTIMQTVVNVMLLLVVLWRLECSVILHTFLPSILLFLTGAVFSCMLHCRGYCHDPIVFCHFF